MILLWKLNEINLKIFTVQKKKKMNKCFIIFTDRGRSFKFDPHKTPLRTIYRELLKNFWRKLSLFNSLSYLRRLLCESYFQVIMV